MPGWNWQKIKQMLSNTLRLNFCYLKIIHILHQRYHLKIIGHILKNKQKNKCFCIDWIIRLIIMKMKMKIKNRSNRYNMNRPRSRHGHKYRKYKKCLSMMMLIYIKQQLSNIWSSIRLRLRLSFKKALVIKKRECIFLEFVPAFSWKRKGFQFENTLKKNSFFPTN